MVVNLHVDVGNWIFRTSAHSGQLHLLRPCLLWPKDLFIIIHKYTVVDFRLTRRGCQISLRVVVSHHVVAGIWTQNLRKSNQCSYSVLWAISPTTTEFLIDVPFLKEEWYYKMYSTQVNDQNGYNWNLNFGLSFFLLSFLFPIPLHLHFVSHKQVLVGICNSVWVWWLFMGWIPRWGVSGWSSLQSLLRTLSL